MDGESKCETVIVMSGMVFDEIAASLFALMGLRLINAHNYAVCYRHLEGYRVRMVKALGSRGRWPV